MVGESAASSVRARRLALCLALVTAQGCDQTDPPGDAAIEVVADAAAMFNLGHYTDWNGSKLQTRFDASVQLWDRAHLSRTPPWSGTDECVSFPLLPPDEWAFDEAGDFVSPARIDLVNGDARIALVDPSSVDFPLYSWFVDPERALPPRFGGRYGFEASGGQLGQPLALQAITLPAALSFPQLENQEFFDSAIETLTWTGASGGVLHVSFGVWSHPSADGDFWLVCAFRDDGEQELPEAVRAEMAGNGLAHVHAERRNLSTSADGRVWAVARVAATYRLGLGEPCDRPDVAAACDAHAAATVAAYAEPSCRNNPWPQDQDSICASFVGKLCNDCPEYYECMAASTRCEGNYPTHIGTCGCPAR